jgi:hypothetical protein
MEIPIILLANTQGKKKQNIVVSDLLPDRFSDPRRMQKK